MATSASPSSLPVLPPLGEPSAYNENYIFYWNSVALDLLRLTVTLAGPLNGPPSSARVLGVFHLAVQDAYFGVTGGTTYLSSSSSAPSNQKLPPVDQATDPRQAVAAAAITVLNAVYSVPNASIANATTLQLAQFIQNAATAFNPLDTLSPSYRFGVAVAQTITALLAIPSNQPGFDQGNYRPVDETWKFQDDPTNPIRIVPVDVNNPTGPQKAIHVYNAPFYGMSAPRLAVHHIVDNKPDFHCLGDPPVGWSNPDTAEYLGAFRNVHKFGGASDLQSTVRSRTETAIGYFWAYDGTNLIGTPLRLYNQILRQLAWSMRPKKDPNDANHPENCADFVRVFGLVNTAMADAGIFAWQEKWCYQFWRPLTGVRQDPGAEKIVDGVGDALADPFWLALGAPETNNNLISFKPPFPSYPSGHATFGGAGFQMMRLHYNGRSPSGRQWSADESDDIAFDFVSDELNGVNRDLRGPYNPLVPIDQQIGTIRTKVTRHFDSLWEAMFENALSRIFLGVHWRFDAFGTEDTALSVAAANAGAAKYKVAADIKYQQTRPRNVNGTVMQFPVGGVPLGIGIANDIWQSGMNPTPAYLQPSGRYMCGDLVQGITSIQLPALAPTDPVKKAVNGSGKAKGNKVDGLVNGGSQEL